MALIRSGRSVVRDRLKQRPRLYWALRRAGALVGDLLPPVELPGVPGRIHRNDTMIPRATRAHAPGYGGSGCQAAAFVAEIVAGACWDGPALEGLDLGCGYGRVLRHLVRTFPHTHWTASDIEKAAVRFCRREFGATAVVSSPNLGAVRFPTASYDIAWMGSLLTHLDADGCAEVAKVLARHTSDRAILAFSTHGASLVDRLDRFGPGMGSNRTRVASDLATQGFSYVPYPHYRDGSYGISFHDPAHIDRVLGDTFGGAIERVEFRPRGWVDLHDLHGFAITRG